MAQCVIVVANADAAECFADAGIEYFVETCGVSAGRDSQMCISVVSDYQAGISSRAVSG